MNDESYMRMALELASNGAGWVNPNPQVGAVVVKDGIIIGEGWHTSYGKLHAEREALADCARRGNDPAGATIYVTLEPCCHQGKQPPCTEALIQAGISRVVMGAPDPNPLVAGKGITQLQEAGITVDQGVLTAECEAINHEWMHFITTGKPYVTMKFAMTLDGKIATFDGDSKWVTGEVARARVHEDRAKAAAILVGAGTVLADDPSLTARVPGRQCHNPLRVIADTHARIPLTSQVVTTAREVPTLLCVHQNIDPARIAPFQEAGVQVALLPLDGWGHVSMAAIIDLLACRRMDSLIVEGGAETHWSLLESGLINRVQAYIAPKISGGRFAPSPVGGQGVRLMNDATRFGAPTVTALGDDVLLECEAL